PRGAGAPSTVPLVTSKMAPCHGHVTSSPMSIPSERGPPRWVQVSSIVSFREGCVRQPDCREGTARADSKFPQHQHGETQLPSWVSSVRIRPAPPYSIGEAPSRG